MTSETDLRDQLAVDRTHLANERTLLAYIRTALAMVGAGAGLLHFFQTPGSRLSGGLLITAGVVGLLIGIWRFRTVRRHIAGRGSG
jgi:putative membrane protein